MTQKHTPKPWLVAGDSITAPSLHQQDCIVEHVYGPKANALLIAAAPELLGALKSLLALDDNTSPFGGEIQQDRIERTIDRARAAIAKAEGGND